jgi:Protein of unknown function (DUF2877)
VTAVSTSPDAATRLCTTPAMSALLSARSISRPIREQLERKPFAAHVLAVFDQACDLVTPDGNVIALVIPSVGNGPLNIVVDGTPGVFASLSPGTAATLRADTLQINDCRVDLKSATTWEPCPAWDVLRNQWDTIVHRLPSLEALALQHAPAASLVMLALQQVAAGQTRFLPDTAIFYRAQRALRAGWNGDLAQLREGAMQLAGLGSGLTPAGDDFLAGMMLWAWLAHPKPHAVCHSIVQAGAPLTTTLSAAFLRAAARGECGAAWHRLLDTLGSGSDDELEAAAQQVISYGATSGADTLAGFLWAGRACGCASPKIVDHSFALPQVNATQQESQAI